MFKLTGLGLVGVALSVLIAQPAWADIIPSKRAAAGTDEGRIQERLVRVGIGPAEAQSQAAALPQQDVAYFAAGQERVQVVAGLWLDEWLVAGFFIVVLGAVYWVIQNDINKKDP